MRHADSFHASWYPAVLAAIVAVVGCGDSSVDPDGSGDVVGGVDLAALFAPPTAAERAAVESDWAQREPSPEAVAMEDEREVPFPGGAFRVRVISHRVDGHRHYGAILEPADPPAAPMPVLVYAHGGDRGTSLDEVLLLASALGLSAGDYVLVAPSYRAEALRVDGEAWLSEGHASPWDRDVDDALALLDVALSSVPFADGDRIAVVGASRGGTVGLLMAVRDPRIRAVVSFFAPTDFLGPFVQEVVREILLGAPSRDLPGIGVLADDFLLPLQEGTLAMEEARLELLRRSPARFADRIPAVQIHHGSADDVVPVGEAERLAAAMEALGRQPPNFEAHIYPGAGHNPLDMPQSLPRTKTFLDGVLEAAVTLEGGEFAHAIP